jgi:hypothetical protein
MSRPSLATEAIGVKANEKLPPNAAQNEVIIFENKANGKPSKAYLKYTKEQEKAQRVAAETLRFPNGDIRLISHSPISSLPEHSLWTYQISGLTPSKSNRTIRVALEKTPPTLKLIIPNSCKVRGHLGAEKFDPSLLKQMPEADSLCTQINVIDGVTYFEKSVPLNVDTVNISFVATSTPASPLIGVQASIPGYQPITKMTPGPNVE